MKKIDTLEDGVGAPDWKLSMCLLLAWVVICLIMMKGVIYLLNLLEIDAEAFYWPYNGSYFIITNGSLVLLQSK